MLHTDGVDLIIPTPSSLNPNHTQSSENNRLFVIRYSTLIKGYKNVGIDDDRICADLIN